MVLFDSKGCLRQYSSELDIIREFFDLRLDYYQKRKDHLEGMLEAEALRRVGLEWKMLLLETIDLPQFSHFTHFAVFQISNSFFFFRLSNQARFILEKCDGSLTVENKRKKAMVDELQRKGFDSDPVF